MTHNVAPDWARDGWADHVSERFDYDPQRTCRCCHIERPTITARKGCESRYGIEDRDGQRIALMFLTVPLSWEDVIPGASSWDWASTFDCCPACHATAPDASKLWEHMGECYA